MRTLKLSFLAVFGLAIGSSGAQAGSITSTIGGLSYIDVVAGTLVTVDNLIIFGPTPVGGTGAGIEVSFDFAGGTGLGGLTNIPVGWFDLSGGVYGCGAGHCENIVSAGDFFGIGAFFPAGATFALASVLIDTTGLAPGVYAVYAGLTGPGDVIANPGGIDLSGEYFSVGAEITIIPEPTTTALLRVGLAGMAIAGRRRR